MNISLIPTREEVLDYIEDSSRRNDYTIRVISKLSVEGETYYSCMDDNYLYSFHQWIPESLGKECFMIAQFLNEYDEEEAYGVAHYYENDLCNDVNTKFTMYEYIPKESADDEMWPDV